MKTTMNISALLLCAAPLCAAAGSSTTKAPQSIAATAAEAGSFKTLLAAVKAADLGTALGGDTALTVFAPTDEAFAKLPKETLSALLLPRNKEKLVEVLTYHVVAGSVSAQKAVEAERAPSLQKGELTFRIDGGRLLVNDAAVVQNDVACSNGVIHAIDSVLLPPGGLELQPAGRLIIGVRFDQPSKALADQLQVDRHGSVVLSTVTAKSPAAHAGLRRYDVLTAIDGQPATSESLAKAKERVGYGGHLEVHLIRRGQPMTVSVEVGIDPH